MNTDNWFEEMEIEQKIGAGEATLNRLQMLVQKGYQPDFGGELLGAIWLYHPRESFQHKQLILYGSGLVVSSGQSDEYRFGREEAASFNRFLKTVPIPSFWERTRRWRINTYAWLIIYGVMLGGGIAAMAAYEFAKTLFH